MARIKNLLGQRFGLLVVAEYAGLSHDKKATWKCICDCGVEKVILSRSLKFGSSKSCGCVRKENAAIAVAKTLTVHGKTSGGNSKIYRIWSNMMTRCGNPKASNYKYYGGRGISVDKRWHSFLSFYQDMGECPDGLTLDRIDVNGNYSKENCRWADWATQCANKRKNIKSLESMV